MSETGSPSWMMGLYTTCKTNELKGLQSFPILGCGRNSIQGSAFIISLLRFFHTFHCIPGSSTFTVTYYTVSKVKTLIRTNLGTRCVETYLSACTITLPCNEIFLCTHILYLSYLIFPP